MALTTGPARRGKGPRPPLDAAGLEALALAYAARYATTAHRLAGYCRRKLDERGWNGPQPPDIAALVARFVRLGYVDDAAWADGKARSLASRGYGAARLRTALRQGGVDGGTAQAALDGAGASAWAAALRLAERRRFGPFGTVLPDRDGQRRQLAAMLRAGHPFGIARAIVGAGDRAALESLAATGEGGAAGEQAEEEWHDED